MNECMNESIQAFCLQARSHTDYPWTFLIYRQELDKAGLSLLPEMLAPRNNQTLIPKNPDGAGWGQRRRDESSVLRAS